MGRFCRFTFQSALLKHEIYFNEMVLVYTTQKMVRQ